MTDQEKVAVWNWAMTSRASGIPSKKYKYDFQGDYKNPFNHLSYELVPYGNLFICTASDDGLVVFNRNDGEIVIRKPLDRYINGIVNIRHNGRYLYADPYIVDLETFEIVHDPWPAFDAYGIEPRPRGRGFITGHYAIRELNPDKHPGHWWVLDLNTWKETIQDVGASWPGWMFYQPDQVVCNANGKLQIRNIADMSVVAEKELPGLLSAVGSESGIEAIVGDEEGGYYIDDRTLQVLGGLDASDCINNIPFKHFDDRISPLSTYTDRRIDGWYLYCYHWKKKELLWTVKFTQLNQVYIAGDLIFASANGDRVVAIDKWTGEIVWEAEDPYQPWSIHFYEKDVYFMDMGDNIRCYQWDEEYVSPHRPTDPNEAWIRPE